MFFLPLMGTVSFIPLVGYLEAHGISCAVLVFAFVLAFTLTPLVIALAWLSSRPLIGFALLAVVGLGCYCLFLINLGDDSTVIT